MSDLFEAYMVVVAFVALTSWLPQIHRILQTKSTDDLQFGQATSHSAILDCVHVVCVHIPCFEIPHRPYLQVEKGIVFSYGGRTHMVA